MSSIDMNAMNFTGAGTLMNMEDLIEMRKKKGQCVTCGRQTHAKKIFKMIPLTVADEVLDGRCLRCQPLEAQKSASFARATHKLMIAARATQAFQASMHAEPEGESSEDVKAHRQAAVAGVTGKSLRSLDASAIREPSRSRLDVTSAISTRRLNVPQTHDVSGHRQLAQTSSPQPSVSSRLDSLRSIGSDDSKLGSTSAQGENSRASSNRSIMSNSDTALSEQQNEILPIISTLCVTSNSLERSLPQDTYEQALKSLVDLSNPMDVVQVMKEHPHSALIQIEACKMLGLSYADRGSIALSSDELKCLYNCVLAASCNHSDDILLQETVLQLLSATPFVDDDEVDVRHLKSGLKQILSVMRNFPDNSKLQQYGSIILSKLSSVDCYQLEIYEQGGIKVLISSMTAHSLDASVQEAACLTLLNLCSQINLKEAMSNEGGIDSISIAMVMHPTNLLIQELGCGALCQLSANNDENKIKIEESGGIDAIITAMQVHRAELNLQKKACLALSNLAINATNKVIIGESGGIDVILLVMQDHEADSDLQELACRFLWTLSVSPENKELIAQHGGIQAIINTMQYHTDSAGVQEKGCGCLSNLASNSEQNKRTIVDEGGIDAIVLAMVLHPEERLVQEKAINCLKKLASEPYLDALYASGVVSLVEQAAEKFPSNCRTAADQLLHLLE